jgi:uncharacterized protein
MRSLPQMLIALAVVTSIIVGWHYYLWARLVRDTALPAGVRLGLSIALCLLGLSMPVMLLAQRSLPREVAHVLAFVAYGWMGVAFFLFFSLVAMELLRPLLRLWLSRDVAKDAGDAAAVLEVATDADKRLALARIAGGIAAALGVGTSAYGLSRALGSIPIERVTVALPRLPASLSGLSIVQISDVHIGPTMGGTWLRGVVEKVNSLDPDVVVITGDLVDGTVAVLGPEVRPLADLKAKHGVFFVTGNHEYYSGAADWVLFLTSLGIRVLENEHVSIERDGASFDLAGVNDFNAPHGGHDVAKAVAGRDESRALVLLAHQPRSITEAAAHGVGLQLSGHTHGGQMFPWNLLVRLQQPFVAGLHRLEKTWIYVHRGTGFWGPPMRVGAPPEIARIELVSEGAAPAAKALFRRPERRPHRLEDTLAGPAMGGIVVKAAVVGEREPQRRQLHGRLAELQIERFDGVVRDGRGHVHEQIGACHDEQPGQKRGHLEADRPHQTALGQRGLDHVGLLVAHAHDDVPCREPLLDRERPTQRRVMPPAGHAEAQLAERAGEQIVAVDETRGRERQGGGFGGEPVDEIGTNRAKADRQPGCLGGQGGDEARGERDEQIGQGDVEAEAARAGLERGRRGDRGGERPERLRERLGHRQGAGRGPERGARTHEQGIAEREAELGEAVARRRLGDAETPRGAGDVALFEQDVERHQVRGVEARREHHRTVP